MRKPTCLTLAAGCAAGAVGAPATPAAAQPWFATRVIEYRPAPGQFVNNPQFSDPSRALGAPAGAGTNAPDHSKVVSLGGFGGSITLGFDRTVLNDQRNPHGMDAIVFGNAFYPSGTPGRRFAEAAVIEISRDVNGNGLADDPWYVICGSHLCAESPPHSRWHVQTWDDDFADPTHGPASPAWVPPGHSGVWTTAGYRLPEAVFGGPVLANPLGPDAELEGAWGYADMSPTLLLGDMTGDNVVDNPAIAPDRFYTVPDDPRTVGITPGSGGGDAFDIAWAVDPITGAPANLDGFDFIRITTAVHAVNGIFGEVSAEIGGVAVVRPRVRSDFNGDGVVNSTDLSAFITAWLADVSGQTPGAADFNGDGVTNSTDLSAFVTAWLAGE